MHRLETTNVAARMAPVLRAIPVGSDLVVITTAGVSANPFADAVSRSLSALARVMSAQRRHFHVFRVVNGGFGLYDQFEAVVYRRV